VESSSLFEIIRIEKGNAMGTYLEVTCLRCGDISCLYEDQIEEKEYQCPCCGMVMSKSQWRKAKINFYVAEELLRQAAGVLGDESSAVEFRGFDFVCRSTTGLPIMFETDTRVTVTTKKQGGKN